MTIGDRADIARQITALARGEDTMTPGVMIEIEIIEIGIEIEVETEIETGTGIKVVMHGDWL